jgi:hypothetical protein
MKKNAEGFRVIEIKGMNINCLLSKYFAFSDSENRVFSFKEKYFCYSASTEAQNMQ